MCFSARYVALIAQIKKCERQDLTLLALRSSVSRGSESPPDSHSLPLPFKSTALINKKSTTARATLLLLVRATGLEPARGNHQILSLARLPIPPRPHIVNAYIISRRTLIVKQFPAYANNYFARSRRKIALNKILNLKSSALYDTILPYIIFIYARISI